MNHHPSEAEVEAVLDREASEEEARRLRAHVADCEECGRRYGAWFELEAWSPALDAERAAAPAPPPISHSPIAASGRSRRRRRVLVAAAAAVLGLALIFDRLAPDEPDAPAPPPEAFEVQALRLTSFERVQERRRESHRVVVRTAPDGDDLVVHTQVFEGEELRRRQDHRWSSPPSRIRSSPGDVLAWSSR